MRALVMGGGVVGVTTAYQLLQDGHEVILVERRAGPALETSWGNAGMIAPGHSFAWSSPQAPMILLKSLFAKNQALRFRPSVEIGHAGLSVAAPHEGELPDRQPLARIRLPRVEPPPSRKRRQCGPRVSKAIRGSRAGARAPPGPPRRRA